MGAMGAKHKEAIGERYNFIFPQNSSGITLQEGNGNYKGILYCGRKYTSYHGCRCKKCDGVCGPDSGCPCPECDYILSYSLYSTGKMICEKCSMTLIRLNIADIQKLFIRNNKYTCGKCLQHYYTFDNMPFLHCFNCNYNLCPSCAFYILKTSIPENYIPTCPHFGEKVLDTLYC